MEYLNDKLLKKFKKSYDKKENIFYFGNGLIVDLKGRVVGRWDNKNIMNGYKEFDYLLPDDFGCIDYFHLCVNEFMKEINNESLENNI